MNYSQAIDYLYRLQLFGVKLGLENIAHLLDRLGNPHKQLRFVHIAGTNGKGSVAAMLASICQQAGFKTGLYTSPHLVSFCERIQINGESIKEQEVVRWLEQLRPLLDDIEKRERRPHPTFFEVVTALALLQFAEHKPDIVIWETGMGGRLDATNVVTPLVSVITNVEWDHQAYLGASLEAIAREKSGIIKQGVPVVTAASELAAVEVIEKTCRERSAQLVRIGRDVHVRQLTEDLHGQTFELRGTRNSYGKLRLPLLGSHQAINAAVAVAAGEAADFRTTPEDVREGLNRTRWPGRFQVVQDGPGTVILDGAHNIASAVALKETLCRHFRDARFTLILGILADKNYPVMCAELAPLADTIYTVRVKNNRAADPEDLARACRGANPGAKVEAVAELEKAFEAASKREAAPIVITGSLFLVGEAMDRLPLGLPCRSRRGELTLQ